jgi:hypothetical protein
MANTLTDFIPDLYAALDVVSREQVGFIPAVTLDAQAARAAVGQAVISPVAPAASATDVTPGVTPPDDGDQTIGNRSITITKARRVPVRWNGEQQLGINSGPGYLSTRAQQFAQAMRTLCNEVEADLAALYTTASRAHGTAGTTPFASTLADPAQVRKILVDNGAPESELQMVINTTAGANMRTLAQLTKANEAGSTSLLNQGVLIDIHGFKIRESAKVKNHTKGTGSGYLVNNASNYAAGSTALALDTGTGTVLAGDILTNSETGRDANKYVVGTALSAGSLALNEPGLINGWTNDDAVAVGANYAANMAFTRSAIALATRAPALPQEGDSAADRMLLTDPVSGLTFEVAMYRQYRQVQYEISIAWGVANFKPEHTAILLG